MGSDQLQDDLKPWDGDHTALVHVLWDCRHDGLTLKDDPDKVAARIHRSRWMDAVRRDARDELLRELSRGPEICSEET